MSTASKARGSKATAPNGKGTVSRSFPAAADQASAADIRGVSSEVASTEVWQHGGREAISRHRTVSHKSATTRNDGRRRGKRGPHPKPTDHLEVARHLTVVRLLKLGVSLADIRRCCL